MQRSILPLVSHLHSCCIEAKEWIHLPADPALPVVRPEQVASLLVQWVSKVLLRVDNRQAVCIEHDHLMEGAVQQCCYLGNIPCEVQPWPAKHNRGEMSAA